MPFVRFFVIILLGALCIQSCVLYKKTVYLQDASGKDSLNFEAVQEPQYYLQPKDVLYIRIYNINDETPDLITGPVSANMTSMNLYYTGYVINDSGNVDVPQLGAVHVAGLTVQQANTIIKREVHLQLPYATVVSKQIFKVTVLGEVKTPGVQYISNSQLTIYEALGYAGDLTDYGNRKRIRLVRTIGDEKTVVYLDVTDPNLMTSQYLFVKPNDVIYVEPFRAKFVRINSANVAIFISSVTLLIVLANFFKR